MLRIIAVLAAAPLALTLVGQPAQAGPSVRTAPSELLDVSRLSVGEPPAIAYAERASTGVWTIHGTGGKTELKGRLRHFAPMGSGYVVQTSRSAPGATTRWIGADGTPGAGSWRGAVGLGVSAGGRAVAFTGSEGAVLVIDSEGDRVLRMPSVPATGMDTTAVGVAGENCKEGETNSSGCAVFVNYLSQPLSRLTSSHGIVDTMPFRQISTVHGRWLGGVTKVTDTGSCSVMTRNVRPRWHTCRHSFSDVSPTNELVLGLPASADGLGPTRLEVLDLRSGERVRSWVPDRSRATATYVDQVWEDPEHVLVVTLQDHRWAIVRLGLDGSMEYAVAPRPAQGGASPPLQLEVR